MSALLSTASDVRWAWRMARRRAAFTLAVVATLGVTIAAAATAFGLATAVLWKPLPFADASRLVFVWEEADADGTPAPSRVTSARFVAWRDHQTSFAAMAAFGAAGFTAWGPDGTVMVRGVRVTANFFDTLGIAPVLGRTFLPADEVPGQHRVVVLAHEFWQQWFGGRAEAIGATLRLGHDAYTVVGVMPPVVFPGWPSNPATVTLDPEARQLWVPIPSTPQWAASDRAHLYGVVGRLRPGGSIDAATQELRSLSRDSPHRHDARLTPFRDQFVRDARLPLLILLGTAAAVLAIACANLAALQVSAIESRRSELGVRAALGAGRLRLARQLSTESLLLSVVGGIAGLVLTRIALAALPSLLPPTVPFLVAPALDLRVAAFGAGVALLAGLALGGWPALRSGSAPSPRGTMLVGRSAVYRALVVVQVSLATALVAAASLLWQSLGAITGRDPGFVLDRVLVADVSFSGPTYDTPAGVVLAERRLTDALAALPGVAGAAVAYDHPLEANWIDAFALAGTIPQDDVKGTAQLRIVGPRYFETMGVQVIEGRGFTERDDLTSAGALVVNEAFVRAWGAGLLIGRRVRSGTPRLTWGDAVPGEFTIVGVVEDERFRGLEAPSEPAVYLSTHQFPQRGFVTLVRTSQDPLAWAGPLREAVRRVDPTAPVGRITPLTDILAEQLVARRATTTVVGGLAGTALALAAVGLYGLLAIMVSTRQREMGVRLALGAVPGSIARQVLGEGVRSAIVGVVVGILLALLTGRIISGLLVGVASTDVTTLGLVSAVLIAVAALAALLPAVRAAHIDPVRVLRAD
jgi:predicted permease